MKRIKLTQGKYALVDDQDYEWLNQFKWYASKSPNGDVYYAIASIKLKGVRTTIRMHRLIMNISKGEIVDHINGDGLDNRRKNLRICTNSENCQNRIASQTSTSKYIGVSWKTQMSKWVSIINPNAKSKFLGYFDTELEAAIIYNMAARKYFGKFARPNKLIKIK